MTVEARVALDVGSLHLDVDFLAESNEVVAVVGPNGAGKTTLLRVLAGLVRVRQGRVTLDDRLLEDTALGIHLSAEQRPVSVVFQDYLLFPHLSVLDNVAYGLRSRGVGRQPAHDKAVAWLDRVGLAGKQDARVAGLSGGEAQRVAIARALATDPQMLLLDEPLAAIDASARAPLRRDLRALLAGTRGARIVVTHDPLDALALADRLVVLEAGSITQQGTLGEVTARPRSDWVARLMGVNLYRGTVADGGIDMVAGRRLAVATSLQGEAFGMVHPRSVGVHRARPEGSPRNAWSGQVGGIDFEGDRVRVEVLGVPGIVAEVTPQAAVELHLADGGEVWVTVKATAIEVYSA
ncbi:MAG: molybdate transport system ATP-binding protein [Chloroflexota bacterium]|jgi:molybdate transport system ATP-binding protein|nr:molybdate transport system ATP-binding protein [Chloroflexota bacterium]